MTYPAVSVTYVTKTLPVIDAPWLNFVNQTVNGPGGIQTAAELSAGVTPTNYAYAPGDVRRYGALIDGTTDDTAALSRWLSVGGYLFGFPGTTVASSQLSITLSGTNIFAYGMTIQAKASTNYEKLLWATGLSNVQIHGLTVDVNQVNRVASLTTRSVGIYFDTMTDSKLVDCKAMNAIGYTLISGFGIAMAGTSVRSHVINPICENCGITGKASDGVFLGGTQCSVVNFTSYNCTDTGCAMESSNYSAIRGGSSYSCGAGWALTNATNNDCYGNIVDGVTVYDWSGAVTGGAELGNPLSTSTGGLLNSRISNITMQVNAGVGPCINVVQTGSAITKGMTFSNIRILGTQTQGMLIAAQDLILDNVFIQGTANSVGIQLLTTCARVQIKSPTIQGQFTFGIYSDTVSNVDIITPVIVGDSTNSTYGIYFANTATNCRVKLPVISAVTIAAMGADVGTVPDVVFEDSLTALTYTASMTPNMLSAECQVIAATNGTAFTINAPVNAVSGHKLEIKIVNTSGGALGSATWNSVFKMSSWTNPANGYSRSITFRYNGTNWVQLSQTGVDIPN